MSFSKIVRAVFEKSAKRLLLWEKKRKKNVNNGTLKKTLNLQMILTFEAFMTDFARVSPLVTVCEFVFSQGTGRREHFATLSAHLGVLGVAGTGTGRR